MPNKFTEHYNLSQWEAGDRIHHDDFNADNLKLDEALAGKLGQPEIIDTYNSTGQNYANDISFPSHIFGSWDDWACVCFLVHYTDVDTSTAKLKFSVYAEGKEKIISPLALPGYIVVLMPMHDASRQAGGFIFADRFYSFSADFSYQKINIVNFGVESGNPICPSICTFGCR